MDEYFSAGNSTDTPDNGSNWFSGLLDNVGKVAQVGASVYGAVKAAPTAKQKNAPVVAAQQTSATKYIVIGVSAVIGAGFLIWLLVRGRRPAAA